MEGYSGTPLAKKLGIKNGFTILLVNETNHYKSLFRDFPKNIKQVKRPKLETIGFTHIFYKTEKDLKTYLPKLKPALKKMVCFA